VNFKNKYTGLPKRNINMKLTGILFLLALLVLILASVIYFQNNSVKNQLTQKQTNSMSEEQLGNFPIIEIIQAQLADYSKVTPGADTKKIAIGMIELMLNDLKYYNKIPTGSMNADLIQAIKAYQTKIGSKPTGILLGKEFEKLTNDDEIFKPAKIYPLDTSNPFSTAPAFIMGDNTHIHMEGTWSAENESIGDNPIQDTVIDCDKETQICSESNVMLISQNSNPYSAKKYLLLKTYRWQITQWNENQVIANIPGSCYNTVMNIDIPSKKVISVEYDKDSGCVENKILGISLLKKPDVRQLVGSYMFTDNYYQEIEQQRMETLNPAYIKAVKSIFPATLHLPL
jgi:hypothetical protein